MRLTAPCRCNPTGKAWLPILHTHHDDRQYTALYPNTARAHDLGTTDDWVIIYRDDHDGHGQWTVITALFGSMKGKRIIRGREGERAACYAGQSDPPASGPGFTRGGRGECSRWSRRQSRLGRPLGGQVRPTSSDGSDFSPPRDRCGARDAKQTDCGRDNRGWFWNCPYFNHREVDGAIDSRKRTRVVIEVCVTIWAIAENVDIIAISWSAGRLKDESVAVDNRIAGRKQ